jgi:predicted Zn-dependent protease
MQDYFYKLADELTGRCGGEEVLLLNFSAEESDFVRFNRSLVRQGGSVTQRYLTLELIVGPRHASETFTISGDASGDHRQAEKILNRLRDRLPATPEDPYLLYATDVHSSEQIGQNQLGPVEAVIDAIVAAGDNRDLVGIFAQGGIGRGFANSLGQRNWFSTYSFHFDWCFYVQNDKAVKNSYAGFAWSNADFATKVAKAAGQLEILNQPPKTINPGEYRVYLAPQALKDFAGMIGGSGFGLKAHRTKTTCLLKMIEAGATLDPAVTISENTSEGLSPNFTAKGYLKPDTITLIDGGRYADCLVSPRSAKEYDEAVNSDEEGPVSMDIAPGEIPADQAVKQLDEGVYANSLWYLNFSDHSACRITGMTRFATFWVEGGRIVAPLNVMRFDETAYRALGENLLGLTAEREFHPDASTYDGRSTGSVRLPGALIKDFRLTL